MAPELRSRVTEMFWNDFSGNYSKCLWLVVKGYLRKSQAH